MSSIGHRSAALAFLTLIGLQATAPCQDRVEQGRLPAPLDSHTDRSAGFPARLDRFVRSGETLLVFSLGEVGHPTSPLPTLDAQSEVLDRLLGRLKSADPELPATLTVRFGASRDSLVAALDRRLMAPGADWDRRLGRPCHGHFGEVLQSTLARVVQDSQLSKSFAAHGYALSLTGMNRVDVEPIQEFGGARLPADVTTMQFEATRRQG